MTDARIKVLLIEDNPADARLVQEALAEDLSNRFSIEVADRLAVGMERLSEDALDLVLLDLGLPDSNGFETFETLYRHAPQVPIVVMTGLEDDALATRAVQAGAQDYLVKGVYDSRLLDQSLVHAVERHRLTNRLEQSMAEARSNEQNLRNLIDRDSDGIVVLDKEGRVELCNRAAEQILGEGRDGLIGTRFALPFGGEEWTELEIARGEDELVPVAIRDIEIRWRNSSANLVTIRDLTQEKKIQSFETEHRIAHTIQNGFYPKSIPHCPGFDIAGDSIAADATGGDYYDYFPVEGGAVALAVGDVMGHGLGAALMMGTTHAYIRALSRSSNDVGRILTELNGLLISDIDQINFVTLMLGHLDPISRSFSYASAGHYGYILRASDEVELIEATSWPLGLEPEAVVRSAASIDLRAGDIVLLPTDGIVEAFDPDFEPFGEDRTIEVLLAHRAESARDILSALCGTVSEFISSAGQPDDMTALIVKVEGSG
jgi:serine phosphatase RsbU (regulator of sigma subunit)/DNA-binding NarL/FixJ family response regulator